MSRILTLAMLVISFSIAKASAAAPSSGGTVAERRDQSRYSVRAGPINYTYREPGLMRIKGNMYEVGTDFHRAILSTEIPMWWGIDFAFALGQMTYDGGVTNTTTGVTTPSTEKSHDQIYHLQGFYGLTFLNTASRALDVAAGIGIWALRNKLDGIGSYAREVNYYYLHVDGTFSQYSGPNFAFVTGAQLNLLLIGTVRSKLSDLGSSNSDINNIQNSGFGYRLKAALEFPSEGWVPYLEAYYRYWKIEDSDSVVSSFAGSLLSFKEPANNTEMLGINFGARF